MKIPGLVNTRWIFALSLFFIVLASSACVTGPYKASLNPEEDTDKIIRGKTEPDQPGVAVLVSRDGNILFSKGYGLAHKAQKIPITPNTKFRIGSITKQFTAAAILKLQEEGKLKVSDRLSMYISDYPRGDAVTLHHLLTHTSGIENFTNKIDFPVKVAQRIAAADLIESFKYDDFNFQPGDSFSYSNSGYFLLGHIVEKVSGKSFEQYLQETFFNPLGMNDSGIHNADLNLDNEALGYAHIEGKVDDALNWDMSHAGAAGAMYSTVEDLYRWNEGVFKGDLLSQESLAVAFTGAKTKISSDLTNYGYGWGIGELGGLQLIGHSGGLDGFSSYLARFPEHDLTIAVLHNAQPGFGGLRPGQIAKQIAKVYLRQDMTAPVDTPKSERIIDSTVDPESYFALQGHYDYGVQKILKITAKNDRVYAQLTDQREFEIFPQSATKYFWKVVDAQAEFLFDSSGNVIELKHTQNGRSFRAKKLEKILRVEFATEILDRYAGVFEFNGLGTFTFTRQRDYLVAQVPLVFRVPKQKLNIYSKSETEFFSPLVRGTHLEFVINIGGEVEKAVIYQGKAKFEGVRIE